MSLTLISPPATEPLSLEDMKTHLRLTTSDDDSSVSQLLVAARHALEARGGLAFMPQAWRYALDRKLIDNTPDVLLPLSPIKSIDAIKVVLRDGEHIALDSDQYTAQTGTIGRVRFHTTLPAQARALGGLAIDFTAGHDTISLIPAELRHAIRLLTAHFFENRESASEARVFSIPRSIDALIAPYWRVSI